MKPPERNEFKEKTIFTQIQFCDGECRCEHNTEKESKSTENINLQKPVSFCYYNKSDLEHHLPSVCHQDFGNDRKDWFVKKCKD